MPKKSPACSLLLGLYLLTACAMSSQTTSRSLDRATSTPEPIPSITDSQTVNCDEDGNSLDEMYQNSEWTWLALAVGVSSVEDVVSALGEPTRIFKWPVNERQLACIYSYPNSSDSPEIWIANGTVIGISFANSREFTNDAIPSTLDEAVELFGVPNFVGWSTKYIHQFRSVVWSNHGVQAEVYSLGSHQISSVLYFAPLSESEFVNSIWYRLVPYENPHLSDVVDTLPRDPFDW